MRKRNVSRSQQQALSRAARALNEGEVWEVPRLLWHAIRDHKQEGLLPAWRHLWAAAESEVRDRGFVPEETLEEINTALAEIQLIDESIYKIHLKESDHVCLLLGAGASAPPPSSIPTVNRLLPELWRRAGKIGRDDIDKLARWCKGHDVSNIEDLLTAAHLANFAAKNRSITGLLDYFLFRAGSADVELSTRRISPMRREVPRVDAASIALLQDTLQVLFGLLTGTMLPASPNKGHDAVVDFVKNHPSSSIVTTNYDGCADEALIRAKIRINTYIDEAVVREKNMIDLIKIHGSINWSYCDSCHEVRNFRLLDLKASYENDTVSYAVIGICKNCGGQRRPLLIPPMGLKFIMFPHLILLWNSAREKLEKADLIIVVGFSFSEADTYINKIIERSVTQKESQRLIVCDPNQDLVSDLRSRFSARIDDFDESRILSAVGSAEEVVPVVLSKLSEGAREATNRRKQARPKTAEKKSVT